MPSSKGEAMKDLTSLQERMNKILTDSVKRLKEMAEPDVEKAWSPPVDILELPDSFLLLAEIPGIPRELTSVEVQGQTLIIRGERPQPEEMADGSLYRSERQYGAFERTFNLPVNVDSERIKARIENGVLAITIEKPVEDATRVKVNID